MVDAAWLRVRPGLLFFRALAGRRSDAISRVAVRDRWFARGGADVRSEVSFHACGEGVTAPFRAVTDRGPLVAPVPYPSRAASAARSTFPASGKGKGGGPLRPAGFGGKSGKV